MHRAALQREENSLSLCPSLFSLEKLMKLFGSLVCVVCCPLDTGHARALKLAL